MDEGALLTLEEAAARTGYRKRELRSLVREGHLPAVRAGKRWQVAAADLAMLPARTAAPTEPTSAPLPAVDAPAVDASPGHGSDPVIALIELLRERDQKLAELLEERSQLTGQVGFLLGQLSEREERIQWLEQAALTASPRHSVNVLPADPTPVALIDAWTKPPAADSTVREAGSTAGSSDNRQAASSESSAPANLQAEGQIFVPNGNPDTTVGPAPISPEPLVVPPAMQTQPRRGLFALFRRRAPG